MSELLWITVPGARLASGKTPLALVIVPRLTGAGQTLAGYGMDRWPEFIHSMSFEIAVRHDGGESLHAIEPYLAVNVDEMLLHWEAMFLTPPRLELPEGCPDEWVEVRPYVSPPERGVPEILPTTDEATRISDLYRKEIAGQEWSGEFQALQTAGAARRAREVRHAGAGPAASPCTTPPDFHEACAHLREHPNVLRALGLIVDFEADLPGTVRAIRVRPRLPPWPGGEPPRSVTPWTRCKLWNGHVLPEPREPDELAGGLVAMAGAGSLEVPGDPSWAVVTFDVDAAMTRIPTTEGTLAEEGLLPGLRSAGLSLLRRGRQTELLSRAGPAVRAARGSITDETELAAEDLVLGYRIDVLEEGAPAGWQSLCRRRAEYEIARRRLAPVGEESQVKRDAMAAAGTAEQPALEGDEQVTRWDGWSLAVPRPAPGRRDASESPTGLRWTFTAEAPLPKLRFARQYRVRARIAYLGGMGLPAPDLDAPDTETDQATLPIFYGRFEPVPSPLVVPPPTLGPGEAVERLVVRSLGGIGSEDGPFPDNDRRLLCAPPISIELADQHGMFDSQEDDREASWELARRALPGLEGEDQGDTARAGEPVPWLPDPLAHGVLFRRNGDSLSALWAWGAGPSVAEGPVPLELELRRGESLPWAAGERASISLAPAWQLEVQLSSFPSADHIDELALHGSLAGPAANDGVRSAVLAGRHPHITPARKLHLVHAVQRPLVAPKAEFLAEREPGDTFATLVAREITLDRASTVQLDLAAEWLEWGDEPTPGEVPPKAIVGSTQVSWIDEPWEFEPMRHEFGDTRHRRVTYRLTAVSRFQEYFPEDLKEGDSTAFCTPGQPLEVHVPSSARPREPDMLYTMPAFAWQGGDAQPGWQEWRRSRRGGLLRVHMGPGWHSSGEGEQLAVVVASRQFPARALWPFLTQAGRDPIRATEQPKRWVTARDVAGATAEPVEVWLEEAQDTVLAVPFTPVYDEELDETGPWYADIDLGAVAGSSYCPFVQVALARYQPFSVARLALSPVVRTEIIQILPDRHLKVGRYNDEFTEEPMISVRLDGVGPTDRRNHVDARIERWTGRPGEAPGRPTTDFAEVGAGDPDIPSWVDDGSLVGEGALGEEFSMSALRVSGGSYRLVVREVEALEQAPAEGPMFAPDIASRVIFVDTVPLES